MTSACNADPEGDDGPAPETGPVRALELDNCAHALNGGYCGTSTMDGFSGRGDSHTIYFCSAHRTTSTTHCSTNCVVAPEGHPDFCAQPVDHCRNAADGVYCGQSTMDGFDGQGDSHLIYFCSGHATNHTTSCPNVCLIAPSGEPDTCSTCGGPVCGTRCCAAGSWCGTGNRCCTQCGAGCLC